MAHTSELKQAASQHAPLKPAPGEHDREAQWARDRERLARLNASKTRLVQAVQELSLARDLPTLMAVVRDAARELTGADGATFVLRDREQCYYAEENAIAPLWKGQRFPIHACISGWAMLHREPAVIEDIYADPRVPADAYRPTFVKSLVMVPIRTQAPIGAIGNYWATRRMPTPEEVELLQALANTTAVAMENVQVYNELEQRVKERTAQLEAANRELESFSYAVSHDLSSPLRAMTAYAELLASAHRNALPAAGQDLLQRMQTTAVHMRHLMDDLLRLSKISATGLHRQPVDVTSLVHTLLRRLSADTPQRPVECHIQPGVEAEADLGLLEIALENLLSNALKYSARTPHPRLEFGCRHTEQGPTYFVRDNGAGFDMQYASQLFQPFRRLHPSAEFAGTGIGLATVQRIVQRHGGRIWAEAAVGQGACFSFTLRA